MKRQNWTLRKFFVWEITNQIHFRTDIYKWFDITLGNCFTFNHRDLPKSYNLRYAGDDYGFKTLMRVRQDEYLAWIDTASLLVFAHPSNETIFAESVRYQVAPSTSAQVITSKVSYQRLGGKYGDCANSVNEVESYYYEGSYTTAGCLRSCYQDAVKQACECMDPRYAMSDDVKPCAISMWNCVQNVTDVKGDASNWPECNCPAPCQESQFESAYGVTAAVSTPLGCSFSSATYESCKTTVDDMAMITVMMPRLSQQLFVESPKMTFNQLISYTGGMVGMFIGFSIITIVDVAVLLILLIRACLFQDNGKSLYGQN